MKYDFFLPEAFGRSGGGGLQGQMSLSFQGDEAAPVFIDGFRNDDSYRSSRLFGCEYQSLASPRRF